MNKQQLEENARRFKFLSNYDSSKPTSYKPQTLMEFKKGDTTIFTHNVLQEMREGKIKSTHPLFEILYNVTDILLTEAYDTFSDFMSKLKTDKMSLQNPDNEIRRVYQGFVNGTPQRWRLIDPDEYIRCIKQYNHQNPQSGLYDEHWAPIIMNWVSNAKDNVAQFAANSYLCSGPTLEQDSENSEGQIYML